MKCLEDPLDFVPPGDWFCPDCEDRMDLALQTRVESVSSRTVSTPRPYGRAASSLRRGTAAAISKAASGVCLTFA